MELTEKQQPSESPEFWVPRIRKDHDRFEATLRSSLAVAIDLGKQIMAAKEALPHGQFGRLFSGHDNPVPGAMPFQVRWAQKLMGMASHPIIGNASHGTHLPTDLHAIFELATMKAAELKTAIDEGKITAKTTRAEAKRIKAEFAEPDDPSAERAAEGSKPRKEKPRRSEANTLADCEHAIDVAIDAAKEAYPSLKGAIAAHLRLIIKELTQ